MTRKIVVGIFLESFFEPGRVLWGGGRLDGGGCSFGHATADDTL